MGYARSRTLTVAADGATNQTAWISLKSGGVATIEGTITGAVTLQRRGKDGVIVDATDSAGTVIAYTKIGTYPIETKSTQADYRLNAKSGAVSAFPFIMMIEGR